MPFIIITAIIIYFVLIAWTWKSLGMIEKTKKIIFLFVGIIIMYIITIIVFQLSKSGIQYPSLEIQSNVKNVLVTIFTGLNGIIVMPQVGKILDKINEDEIDKKQLQKRLLILCVIFVICLFIESGYMKDTQEGILRIYNSH